MLRPDQATMQEKSRSDLNYLKLVNEIGCQLSRLLDSTLPITHALELITEGFDLQVARLYLLDSKGTLFLHDTKASIFPTHLPVSIASSPETQTFLVQAAATGQTQLRETISHNDSIPSAYAIMAVPLRVGQRVTGILEVQSRPGCTFPLDAHYALEILGTQIGTILETHRLVEETEWRFTAMSAIHETGLDIVAQLELQQVLDAMLRRGATLLDSQSAAIYLSDEAREYLYVAAISGNDYLRGKRFPLDKGMASQAVLTGIPQIWDGLSPYPDQPKIFRGTGEIRALIVPLTWQNETIGAIGVYRDTQRPAFTTNDSWILGIFAGLASISIKNATLFERVKDLSHDFELKVEQRTRELRSAKKELAIKATQLRSLLKKTLTIQEEERARISRDLHDGVVQLITAIRYELKAIRVTAESSLPDSAREKLESARDILDDLEREMRAVIYDLQPPLLDSLGLIPALEKYVVHFQTMVEILCTLRVIGERQPVHPSIEVGIFRIIEEALHNIMSHAVAQNVSITLDYHESTLRASIRDDGQGFDYDAWRKTSRRTHLGLLSMQERARALGGSLKIWSTRGKGTHILFELPIHLEAPPLTIQVLD